MRTFHSFVRVALVASLMAATVVIGSGAAEVAAASCQPWVGDQPPVVGTYTNLVGVTVLSPCNAWAVGTSSVGTVAEQWTGGSWISVATPNIPTATSAGLNAVAGSSPSSPWAVGTFYDISASKTLIERWSGNSWSIVKSRNPSLTSNTLSAVSVDSPSDAWVAGSFMSGGHYRALLEHWNGHAWKLATAPAPPNATDDEHLDGVVATSPTNAWAVGVRQVGMSARSLVLHWNGTSWKVQTSVNPGGTGPDTLTDLWAVAATSANNAWAVGAFYNHHAAQQQTLVEHWDGHTWKIQTSANPSADFNALLGVAAASPTSAWAVGYRQGSVNGVIQPRRTLIEHWDGTSWSIARSPNPGGNAHENDLNAVAAGSASNVWAVGQYQDATNTYVPLAVHCC